MTKDRNADLAEGEVVFLDEAELKGESAAGSNEVSGPGADELEQIREEMARYREQYLRKLADFENYRRRQDREMIEFRRLSHADLVKECLPVLDNLERALDVTENHSGGLRDGVELIMKQLKDVLARFGLQEVNPVGAPFDPEYHEAVQRQEVEGAVEPTIVQVLLKGYMVHDRLVRPAMVVVGVPAAATGREVSRGVEDE